MCVCECALSRSVVSDSLRPPGTAARQAHLSVGIFQARILEWVAMPSSRGSSQPRDWIQVSCIADRIFTVWATRETQWWWRAGSSSVPWGYPLTQIHSLFLHCSTALCLHLNPQKGQILWRVNSFLLRKWLRHCTHHFLCRMLIFCTFSDSLNVRPLCDSWLFDSPWPPVAWVDSGRVVVPVGLISLLLWKSWAFYLAPMREFYALYRYIFLASGD